MWICIDCDIASRWKSSRAYMSVLLVVKSSVFFLGVTTYTCHPPQLVLCFMSGCQCLMKNCSLALLCEKEYTVEKIIETISAFLIFLKNPMKLFCMCLTGSFFQRGFQLFNDSYSFLNNSTRVKI